MGDLIFFPGKHKRETQGEGLRISWDVVDWNRGSSGVEATGEPWDHPGNERETGDRGASSQEGPWDRGRVLLGIPWSRGRKTVEQVRHGNWAGAEDCSTQGERLRESTGKERK